MFWGTYNPARNHAWGLLKLNGQRGQFFQKKKKKKKKKNLGVDISGQKMVGKRLFLYFLEESSFDLLIFGLTGPLKVFGLWVTFGLQKISAPPDTGPFVTPTRPPKGSLGCFMKAVHQLLLILCLHGALFLLNVCVTFGDQNNSGSPDTGPIVTPKRLFGLFLADFSLYFANFPSGRGFYSTSGVCTVWSPVKLWFPRYGANPDPGKALWPVSCRLFIRFC